MSAIISVVADSGEDVELGRRAYRAGAWAEAYAALRGADQGAALSAADIELLGRVAYMLGYDDDYIAALERAHKLYVEAGSLRPAIRCAWWIGHNLLFRGEWARASGWFAVGSACSNAWRATASSGATCSSRCGCSR